MTGAANAVHPGGLMMMFPRTRSIMCSVFCESLCSRGLASAPLVAFEKPHFTAREHLHIANIEVAHLFVEHKI